MIGEKKSPGKGKKYTGKIVRHFKEPTGLTQTGQKHQQTQ